MVSVHKENTDRIYFLDNIRYLMVLLVVVLHSAGSYTSFPIWHVNDKTSSFFDVLMMILDVFLMPTLFFIAGYFALPSLYRKNTWSFIKHKFKRLGIPWLIGVSLLGPIQAYIYQYSHGYPTMGLWRIFVERIKVILSFNTVFLTKFDQFNHLHFWFISLLLVFFIVFALLHGVKSKFFTNSFSLKTSSPSPNKTILVVFFLTAAIAVVLNLLIFIIFSKALATEPFLIVGSLIQFQPTRIVLYILCFSLGIYSFYKKWFVNGKVPGHIVFWAISSFILYLCFFKALTYLLENPSLGVLVGCIFIRIFLVFSMILIFISFGANYWESASKINRSLAENSFNIYLLHFVFVYLSQLFLLKTWNGSIYIKFVIVCISSSFLSYVVSQYAIRQFPRLSVAGMVGVFALASVFLTAG